MPRQPRPLPCTTPPFARVWLLWRTAGWKRTRRAPGSHLLHRSAYRLFFVGRRAGSGLKLVCLVCAGLRVAARTPGRALLEGRMLLSVTAAAGRTANEELEGTVVGTESTSQGRPSAPWTGCPHPKTDWHQTAAPLHDLHCLNLLAKVRG